MKLNRLSIDEQTSKSFGLESIKMERLGSVVALVGKNGSGKTRLLQLLLSFLKDKLTITRLFDGTFSAVPEVLNVSSNREFKDILLIEEKIKLFRDIPPTSDISKSELSTLQAALNVEKKKLGIPQNLTPGNPYPLGNKLEKLVKKLEPVIATIYNMYVKVIKYEEIKTLNETLQNQGKDFLSFEMLIKGISMGPTHNELSTIYSSALPYLRSFPNDIADTKFECLINKEMSFEETDVYKKYLSLKNYFKIFLDKDLEFEIKKPIKDRDNEGRVITTHSGTWRINGREFNYNEFSSGEKILFAYVLMFFLLEQNPKIRIRESILIIDEPEIHLHPDLEVKLIDGIRQIIEENGQLWIATHSLSILSNLKYDEIFMLKNGVVSHPSQSTPKESLTELMGLEERVSKLSDFLSSMSNWAFVEFMAQCFLKPDIIESARPNDPQVILFKETLQKFHDNERGGEILDFGAGKGRLYERIKDEEIFISKVSYSAFEPDIDCHPYLRNLNVRTIYGSIDDLPKSKFDFVLLCNVLHEIPVENWETTLNHIYHSLSPVGYIVIIEDRMLPKGENIGTSGYLILDLEEIRQLFNVHELPSSITLQDGKERIMCAIINKNKLKPIKNINILKAMNALEINTFNKIKALRLQSEVSHQSIVKGRYSAFLSQLYINSKLAQIALKKE